MTSLAGQGSGRSGKRRFLAPEVVQSSAMDCGPAALKSLLAGYGVEVSYARLREVCQTDVDGTSIDTLEAFAGELGLDAEQVMIPIDHLLLEEAGAVPAIVVTSLPNGSTHFVLLWRRHGPWVQVMDPSIGRRWLSVDDFLSEVYVHEFPVPPAGWREWAGDEEALAAYGRRLEDLGVDAERRHRLLAVAVEDPSWHELARLDAALRMVAALRSAGGVSGEEAIGLIERARAEDIPAEYWSVRSTEDGEEELLQLRGALLVRAVGQREEAHEGPSEETAAGAGGDRGLGNAARRARATEEDRPLRRLAALAAEDGRWLLLWLAAGAALAAGGVLLEALLFRALLDVGRQLDLPGQRVAALAAVAGFALLLLILELPITQGGWRLGRKVELRLRIAFLRKLPRLGERYFSSRLASDMAERSHSVHQVRNLGPLGVSLVRAVFELVFITAGIVWLDPALRWIALASLLAALVLPALAQPFLAERDLRLRTHSGALSRFYLDSLLGLVPVRAHAAEQVVRREHEILLSEWARAGLRFFRTAVLAQGVSLAVSFAFAIALVLSHLRHSGSGTALLLLVYWALTMPLASQEVMELLSRLPWMRNRARRILEPLGAEEEPPVEESTVLPAPGLLAQGQGGVAMRLHEVSVRAGGNVLLHQITADIAAGEHIALVGRSGSGKTTLIGLLLGFHRPIAGLLEVEGSALTESRLGELRRRTAWVDPSVAIWNRSLIENLRFGTDGDGFNTAIDRALLKEVLESLPDGMRTPLGEGGGLISGGEGQRVRVGRAMMRSDARLVLLDEAFRGLDRESRELLLQRAREMWSEATMVVVTHDTSHALDFDRVLVMEEGRIVEAGEPRVLALQASRFRTLLDAESQRRLREEGGSGWRRWRVEGGVVRELTTDPA